MALCLKPHQANTALRAEKLPWLVRCVCCTRCVACRCSVLKYTLCLYLMGYGVILGVSLLNPEGFILIIEIFGSLALNVECGVFVALMAYESSVANPHYANRYIPVALGAGRVRKLCLFTVVLFGLAVVYDVVSTGVNALGPFPFVLVMVVGIFAVAGYVFRAQFRPSSTRV